MKLLCPKCKALDNYVLTAIHNKNQDRLSMHCLSCDNVITLESDTDLVARSLMIGVKRTTGTCILESLGGVDVRCKDYSHRNIIIETQAHYGEGQTTCSICAYHGCGTGSRCWDSMITTVYVNSYRVGYLCSGCLHDLIKFHEDRGCVVVTQPISE